MALTGDTSQVGSPMMTGESPLQYYLRIGMDPNLASATLVGSMTGNTAGNPVDNAFRALASRQRPHASMGWFGGPMQTENDVLKPTQQWVGNDAPGLYNWQNMPGATPQNNANYMTTLKGYANGSVAPTAPMSANQVNNVLNYRQAFANGLQNPAAVAGVSPTGNLAGNRPPNTNSVGTVNVPPSAIDKVRAPQFSNIQAGGSPLSVSGGPQYQFDGFLKNNQWRLPNWK